MSNKSNNNSSKKSKKSSKKSISDSKRKSASTKPKTAPKSPDKSARASPKSDKKKPTSKDQKPKSSSKRTDKKSSTSKSFVPAAGSSGAAISLNAQLEQARKRLNQLDAECRAKQEEEIKKYDKLEAEQTEKIRKQNRIQLDATLKQLQEASKATIETATKELNRQQKEEMAQLKAEESKANVVSESKRTEIEKDISTKQDEAKADIERFREMREAELAAAIKRLKEQCQMDVKEYVTRRLETNEQMIEQLQQKLNLEMKNDKQKGKLSTNDKISKLKDRYQKATSEQVEKENQALAKAIADQKASYEAYTEIVLAEKKKSLCQELEKNRNAVAATFQEERTKLEAAIEEWESAIKCSLKHEQRELERRKMMKKELLAMLAMEDTQKLTDEELIGSRYHFKIERSQIVQQSNASTLYRASKENLSCYCKVTMFSKWSLRHRAEFAKHSTKLARYLTANHDKAPFFVKMVEMMATDSKLYTFMEPLSSSKTLQHYLESLGGKHKKSSSNKSAKTGGGEMQSNLKKSELTNVLSQVVKGAAFLNNIFIAHASITADNLTLASSADCSDLSSVKVVLTGLTRPIVYYNVESDSAIAVKGFDPSVEISLDPIDHLPPECFEAEFSATHLDGYSIAVLAYVCLRLGSPFANFQASPKKMVAVKKTEPVKLTLDKNESEHEPLAQLVASLSAPQTTSRIPVDDILNHRYFKKQ